MKTEKNTCRTKFDGNYINFGAHFMEAGLQLDITDAVYMIPVEPIDWWIKNGRVLLPCPPIKTI